MEHGIVISEFNSFLQDTSKKYDFSYEIISIRSFMRDIFSKNESVWSFFSDAEKTIMDYYKNPKKRLEWMAGRYAGKLALINFIKSQSKLDLDDIEVTNLSILNGERSAPYIDKYPNLNISISHSYPFCVVIISEHMIGVDMEKTFSMMEPMLKLYYTAHEIDMINMLEEKSSFTNNIDNRKEADFLATLYWTRKEAISKLKKLGMSMDFSKIDTVGEITILNELSGEKIRTISMQNVYCSLSIAIKERL